MALGLVASGSLVRAAGELSSANPVLVKWSNVETGSYAMPEITIDSSIYPNEQGVQFLVNGTPDERTSVRPNGFDATGPQDDSIFHVYPPMTLDSGLVLEARWTDQAGEAWTHQQIVGEPAVPQQPTPTSPAPTTPAPTSDDDVATWTNVEPGSFAMPSITIDDSAYPDGRGVQFFVNGAVDERTSARPGGFDATGPQDDSEFHIYPRLQLSAGDVLEARWTDGSGVARTDQHVVGNPDQPSQPTTTAPATTTPATTATTQPPVTTPATTAPATTAPVTTAPATTAPATTTPATTTPATTPPATTATTQPPTAGVVEATWTNVEPGSFGWPEITIDASVYPDSRGVQFLVNGVVDERSSARPGGFDATGPQDDSIFHIYPNLSISNGDVLEARWTDQSGTARTDQHVVGNGTPTPQPPTTQPPVTEPPVTEPPVTPTVTGDFPTYESTGARVAYSQMTVHQGDFSTSYDGQVVDKMDIRGNLHILHDNVTVRDTRVMMTWNYGLDIRATNGSCPTGTLFEYIEIDGRNASDTSVAVYGAGCEWTLDHARVHNVGSSIHVVRNNTVSNSFVYSSRGETADIHRNAIQHHGGYGNKIINNTLYCEGNGCSSALALYGEVAPVSDILVEHNLMAATAGYCTYTGSLSYKPYPNGSNVRYINNHFSTKYFADCGRAGAVEGSTSGSGNVWQGNVWHETGQPVS